MRNNYFRKRLVRREGKLHSFTDLFHTWLTRQWLEPDICFSHLFFCDTAYHVASGRLYTGEKIREKKANNVFASFRTSTDFVGILNGSQGPLGLPIKNHFLREGVQDTFTMASNVLHPSQSLLSPADFLFIDIFRNMKVENRRR